MPRGGWRGGGRPKGSVSEETRMAQEFRRLLIQRVVEQKEPIITALIEKALAKDVQALKEVLERVLGKVSDKVVLEDGGFLEALVEVRRMREKAKAK